MWHRGHDDFPELCRIVEVLMNDGTLRKDMMIKGKYGNYEWRDHVDRSVVGWRYINEETNTNNTFNTKENKTMMKNNRENRMETLKNAGIDTGKYFSLSLPEGLKPGATINIMISEDGRLIPVNNNEKLIDEQLENYNEICKCISNGYIRNTKLHRRWVMAQMFRMLNYTSWDERRYGYDACLKDRYSYEYQFEMMLDELKVLCVLQKKDYGTFVERYQFFDKDTVIATCEDYLEKLKKYVDTLPRKKCKGEKYVKIGSIYVFVCDLSLVFSSIESRIFGMRREKDLNNVYCLLRMFIRDFVTKYSLPFNTSKSSEWKNAFKGAGSYYTLMNLIKFHGCKIYTNHGILSGLRAVGYVDDKSKEYHGEYYRLFALLKKVIADNRFDFNLAMKEVYANK